jgi:chemotaxis protein MotB
MGRKGEHGGHHGGGWKVAAADFFTSMMALFIVLWILGTSKANQAAVAAYFNHPSILKGEGKGFLSKEGMIELKQSLEQIRQEEAADSAATVNAALVKLGLEGGGSDTEAERNTFSASAQQLEQVLGGSEILREIRGQVKVEFTSQGMRIQMEDLKDRPLFALGSAELTPAGRELLQAVARVIAPLPNALLIEGHTDSRPYSGQRSYTNWELSGERANSARRVLEGSGLDPTRIARVVGYADRQLLNKEEPFSDQNRRISITVTYSGARIE